MRRPGADQTPGRPRATPARADTTPALTQARTGPAWNPTGP
ncbi:MULTISPECIES: hypothetical protein [Streptomyces]|nr:hypothetical protein [Streptomyces sp. NRRL WC-3725]